MLSLQTDPYSLAPAEGKALRSLGSLVSIKAASDQTGGTFNLFEATCPPGFATALQIHYAEDVAIYVLEGALAFFWGGEKKDAAAGSYLYQPRGVPHGFRVEGKSPARILYLTFPGGMDQFITEQGRLAADCESVTAAAQYKIEILGPLPE